IKPGLMDTGHELRALPRRHKVAVGLAALSVLLVGSATSMPPVATWPLLEALGAPRTVSPVVQARARIKHVVFVLLENHTFDNVFGRFPGADGITTGRSAAGGQVPLLHAPPFYWHDISHERFDALTAIDHGKMDGFAALQDADLDGDRMAFQQYAASDIPNLWM